MAISIPERYKWVVKDVKDNKGPWLMQEALKEFGTVEVPGKGNNPKIMGWAKEIGGTVQEVFYADEVPWCGLFMAVICKRAKKEIVKSPLWALNWGNFGHRVAQPGFGDILVFVRRTSTGAAAGHVALYVAETTTTYHVIGGNQSDAVGFTQIPKSRLYVARRPDYKIQPANVRKIFMSSTGIISTNEQ